jgi:hypothetical protein
MPITETRARKKPRPRRSFTAEFKADIVERCGRGDRTVAQVAKDFDLSDHHGSAATYGATSRVAVPAKEIDTAGDLERIGGGEPATGQAVRPAGAAVAVDL